MEEYINFQLERRGSRISGSMDAKYRRLLRFMEIEAEKDKKKPRIEIPCYHLDITSADVCVHQSYKCNDCNAKLIFGTYTDPSGTTWKVATPISS